MTKITHETKDYIVKVRDDPQFHAKVSKAVIKFFIDHECFAGESFSQCDSPQIDAMEFMPELLDDIIKFDCKYKED